MISINKLREKASNYNILYVEDDLTVAQTFREYLEKVFDKVDFADNGEKGLSLFLKNKYDIVITDIQMPKLDGLKMAEEIKKVKPNQNIIVVSAYSDIDKFTTSIRIGIDGYILKPIELDSLNSTINKVVTKIKKFREHAEYEKRLKLLLGKTSKENYLLQEEKIENYEKTLFALVDIIENRDTYTGKHSLRVARYSKLIAEEMGLAKQSCEEIYKAGILHDIGKIAIPDSLLLKPSNLTAEEYELIKEHVRFGYDMLVKVPMFKNIAAIIKSHHERLDGSGYPDGLKGSEIPLASAIMAVADTFDAMTTNRIYKSKKTIEEALVEINSLSELHFRKDVVLAAQNVLTKVKLDSNINQFPETNIEKKRFSYFFNDSLTGLYNETYLDYILLKNKIRKEYSTLTFIEICSFNNINNEYGWIKGNEILKEFSKRLQKLYPDYEIFRVHGKNFIILNTDTLEKEKELITIKKSLYKYNLNLEIKIKTINIIENNIISIFDLENFI